MKRAHEEAELEFTVAHYEGDRIAEAVAKASYQGTTTATTSVASLTHT